MTQQTQQFTTAKAFADEVCTKRYSRSHMMMLNRKRGSERLEAAVDDRHIGLAPRRISECKGENHDQKGRIGVYPMLSL